MNTRQSEILKRLRELGRIEFDSEAAYFDVTPMTIRRDLRILAEAGKVLLTRKGAVPRSEIYEKGAVSQPTPEKNAIARRAWQLLQETPNVKSVMLSTGSTTLAFAKLLVEVSTSLTVKQVQGLTWNQFTAYGASDKNLTEYLGARGLLDVALAEPAPVGQWQLVDHGCKRTTATQPGRYRGGPAAQCYQQPLGVYRTRA